MEIPHVVQKDNAEADIPRPSNGDNIMPDDKPELNETELPILEGKVEIPKELPVLPLKDTIVFPHMIIPLAVGRPKSLKLVDDVVVKDRLLALVAQNAKESVGKATRCLILQWAAAPQE